MTPEPIRFDHPEGGHIAALRWSSAPSANKPLLVFSHATGFHAATYQPLFERLVPHMDVLAADSRGHGLTCLPANPPALKAWTRYYRDLAFLLDQIQGPVHLAGHSIGGLCSLAVASRRPDQVKGVLAMDPVMLDPQQGIPFRVLQWLGRSDRFSLAAGAKKRRAVFASVTEAFDTYRTRKSFASWPDEWLSAYVNGAFENTQNGVELRCKPAWESRTFAMVEHWPWRFIPAVKQPVTLLLAEHGSTCSPKARLKAQAAQPDWTLRELPGSSHFLPMEQTDVVAQAIIQFVCKPGH